MARSKDTPKTVVDGCDPSDTEEMPLCNLADEYCRLLKERDKLLENPIFIQFAECEAKLKARILAEFKPEEIVEVRGECFTVEFGPAAKAARKIKNMARVFKILGEKNFLKICKINIGELEKHIAPSLLKRLLTEPGFLEKRDIKIKPRNESEESRD